MINEVIENVYYLGDIHYADDLIITTTSGNAYRLHANGFEKVERAETKGYAIDNVNNISGLTIIKEAHGSDFALVELSDKRFIAYSVSVGLFDYLDDKDAEPCLEYNVTPAEQYDEHKEIIDDPMMESTTLIK